MTDTDTATAGTPPQPYPAPDDGRHTLHIPNHTGDTRVEWNPTDADEVDIARQAFTNARAKGYAAYKVGPPGTDRGEIIRDFDPQARRIILSRPLAGG